MKECFSLSIRAARSKKHSCSAFVAGLLTYTTEKALTSHQCGPGSNPCFDAICGLSLLLVFSIAVSGFSPGTLVFPSPSKTEFQIPIRRGIRYTKNHFVDVLPPSHYLFYFLIVIFLKFL